MHSQFMLAGLFFIVTVQTSDTITPKQEKMACHRERKEEIDQQIRDFRGS